MKWLLRLLVILCFGLSPGLAQVEHGTVVVVYFTPDKIIMAADSRVIRIGQNIPPNDEECKITVIRGQVIFSSANVASYTAPGSDVVESWKNADEARSA
jgi:hypothetical protein